MAISYYPDMVRDASPHAHAPSERSTTDRLLDAAEARFARLGYEATSLNDVADDVGIRTPSVYKHFANKRAIYVAVLERLLAPYVELLERLLTVPEAPEDGAANLLAVLRHYVATPNLARVVQHATLAGGEELDLLVERWYAPLFVRAAALTPHGDGDASTPGDPVGVVVAFHAMMSGYMTMAPLHERLLGADPLSDRALAGHLGLMQRLVRELWNAPAAKPTEQDGASARAASASEPSAARS